MALSMKPVEFIAIIAIITVSSVHAAKIGISHCNDVGAQMESYKPGTNGSSKAPEACVVDQMKCIGGFSSLVHWLHNNSAFPGFEDIPTENILRLTSGNLIGGESGWISVNRTGWESYGALVKNFIQPTALALGMKDFGAGLQQTISYMKAIGPENFVLANTCENWESSASGTEWNFCNITASIKTIEVKSKNGSLPYRIGIIGFVTPTVERLSLPGKLKFKDIATKIKNTIAASASENIKTFIAIGDGSREIARQIITSSPKVKLVIYGAGFSTKPPTNYLEEYEGSYIATAGKWGSSVGKLVFEINEDSGDIKILNKYQQLTEYPSLVDGLTKKAADEVQEWRGAVKALQDTKIGHSRVDLVGGELCWRQECNLGNLMTDAVVHCALKRYTERPFRYPLHSIWHGGAFFEDTVIGGANISKFDVHKWLPYHNNVHIVKVQGQHLRNIFQASATGLDPVKAGAKDWRQFLQISDGLEVYYETTSDVPKVIQIKIVHDNAGVPTLTDMQDDHYYYLAIPTYLYEGRGVYDFVTGYWEEEQYENITGRVGFDDSCLMSYIETLHDVSVGYEERIWINGGTGGRPDPPPEKPCETKGSKTAVTVILTIVFFSIFLAIIYVGYFYVIPRLRNSGRADYPPNQL